MSPAHERRETTSIAPLLGQLAYSPTDVTADFIASKFALIFEHKISDVQSAAFLALLHCTKKDREPDVIARCSKSMREAASPIDETSLQEAVKASGRPEGNYQGGLVSSSRAEYDLRLWTLMIY
jgi:anthranilate phosphoribosyltransferase